MKRKTRLWLGIIWLISAMIWTGLMIYDTKTADADLFMLRLLTAVLAWIAAISHLVAWYKKKKEEEQ